MKYIKMKREGEIADVADFEVEIWQAAGFEVIYADVLPEAQNEAETEAQTEAPVKRRGRPRKAD